MKAMKFSIRLIYWKHRNINQTLKSASKKPLKKRGAPGNLRACIYYSFLPRSNGQSSGLGTSLHWF